MSQSEQKINLGRQDIRRVELGQGLALGDGLPLRPHRQPGDPAGGPGVKMGDAGLVILDPAQGTDRFPEVAALDPGGAQAQVLYQSAVEPDLGITHRRGLPGARDQVHAANGAGARFGLDDLRVHGADILGLAGWLQKACPRFPCREGMIVVVNSFTLGLRLRQACPLPRSRQGVVMPMSHLPQARQRPGKPEQAGQGARGQASVSEQAPA